MKKQEIITQWEKEKEDYIVAANNVLRAYNDIQSKIHQLNECIITLKTNKGIK